MNTAQTAVDIFPLETILQTLGEILAVVIAVVIVDTYKGWKEERDYRKRVRRLVEEADRKQHQTLIFDTLVLKE